MLALLPVVCWKFEVQSYPLSLLSYKDPWGRFVPKKGSSEARAGSLRHKESWRRNSSRLEKPGGEGTKLEPADCGSSTGRYRLAGQLHD